MPPAVDDFLARAVDGAGDVRAEQAQPGIGPRGGLLHHRQASHEGGEVADDDAGDGEVLDRAQALDSEERVRGHGHRAEQVGLHAGAGAAIGLFAAAARRGCVQGAAVQHERDAAQQFDRQLPVALEHRLERLAPEGQHVGVRHRRGRHAVAGRVKQRAFPEGVARPEHEDALGPVAGVAGGFDAARDDEVQGLARIALAEERRPGGHDRPRARIARSAEGEAPKRVLSGAGNPTSAWAIRPIITRPAHPLV